MKIRTLLIIALLTVSSRIWIRSISPIGPGLGFSGRPVSQSDGSPKLQLLESHLIYLKSGKFRPTTLDRSALERRLSQGQGRVHLIVQLDFIPRQAARDAFAAQGLHLLAYLPDYSWLAFYQSPYPVDDAARAIAALLDLPGLVWAGEIDIEDKLDPAILASKWSGYNLLPGDTAAVYISFFKDQALSDGQALVEAYGGRVVSTIYGINTLVAEISRSNLSALAAVDIVQWIEPAAPPLAGTNDGLRQQLFVDQVNAPPYGLDGAEVDVLVYDYGQVGDHLDFGSRLIHGDGELPSEHSTHVAGTLGGSGFNSAAAGGAPLQWRGMAPAVNLISYGVSPASGIRFYQDPADIEADWAAAQNLYGADIGNASVGPAIYINWPTRCDVMGKYGAADVLIDQIVRGGNSQVGLGERYIATWAAGNERNQIGSCSNSYSSVVSPATAKNPIQVGASNTDDNTMTTTSSWGPTIDGRVKPIVVAGGCQAAGDQGIKSTDNNPVDGYKVMCGTSMATPAVAGGIALMLQHYRDVYQTSANFWPSTARAILMQTAFDYGNPNVDYIWGYGQVNIQAAVDLITRRAFQQETIQTGEADMYSLSVPDSSRPIKVSLAWDDFEATFNASVALVNDLDLELVSPSGVIYRPWVLNPASPAAPALRGVDNRNNQEQVTVINPEIGTWMVRVRGTVLPQSPQSYSLACEGCRSVDVGLCQSDLADNLGLFAGSLPEQLVLNSEGDEWLPAPDAPLSSGERWQSGLEGAAWLADRSDAGRAGDKPSQAVQREIQRSTMPAAYEISQVLYGTGRSVLSDNPAELRVGINGACSHPTIQQAVDAAADGDEIRLSAGVYFETVDVTNKNLTIRGGYANNCTNPGSGLSTVDASFTTGSVFDLTGSIVNLEDLRISWGSGIGGGVDAETSQIVLSNTDVMNNHGTYGGGIYVGTDSSVTIEADSDVSHNTATQDGGGVFVRGSFVGYDTSSDITDNCAMNGGGLSVDGGIVKLIDADVVANQAAGPAGRGGGIYSNNAGQVLLAESAFLGETAPCCQQAYDGGGIYAENSTVTLYGSAAAVINNTAAHDGGGVYLDGGLLHAFGGQIGIPGQPLTGNQALSGAGLYAFNSAMVYFTGQIAFNQAYNFGGGFCIDGSTVNISRSIIIQNSAARGGAIFQAGAGSATTVENTLVISNAVTTLQGAGIRAISGEITLKHVTLANNTGGAGYSSESATSDISNSIVWGNSLNDFSPISSFSCNIYQGGAAGIDLNPLFVSPGVGQDYHLMTASPAVDACDDGLPFDLDGLARPFGPKFDMGAYELPLGAKYIPLIYKP